MFIFKMQSLLDVKKNREEQALLEFQKYSLLLEQEKKTLATMVKERDVLITTLRGEKQKTLKASDIDLLISSIRNWEDRITQKSIAIKNLSQEVAKKHHTLMSCIKERKILEKLKERHFEEYRAHHNTTERLAMDETAIHRHRRK